MFKEMLEDLKSGELELHALSNAVKLQAAGLVENAAKTSAKNEEKALSEIRKDYDVQILKHTEEERIKMTTALTKYAAELSLKFSKTEQKIETIAGDILSRFI